jgi:hypothetical protein
VQKAHDPIPLDDYDDPVSPLVERLVKSNGGLKRALESGAVSFRDRVLIKMAVDNIEAHRVIVHPLDFGETEEHNVRILRIMDEKYSGPDRDTFTKADGGSLVDGLVRAIEANTISDSDRAVVLAELDGLRKGSSYSHIVLARLADRYSDRLEKRARPGLRVGMKVRGIHAGELGKVGTIESIDGPLVRVRLDDGSGESTTLLNATMEALFPVEG